MDKNKKTWIATIILAIIVAISFIFSANDKKLCTYVLCVEVFFIAVMFLFQFCFEKRHDMSELKNKIIELVVEIAITGIMLAVMYIPHSMGLI